MSPEFEIFKDSQDKWRFHLKAPNAKIILASESYNSKQACLEGIEAIKKYAGPAEIKLDGKILNESPNKKIQLDQPKEQQVPQPQEATPQPENNAIKKNGPTWL